MSNYVKYKKSRIVRVICRYKVGDSFGTGFFVTEDGKLLTCFHVIFGRELRFIRNDPDFIKITGEDEHSRLNEFYKNKISMLEIELSSGEKLQAELLDFSEKYDTALLKLSDEKKVNFFEINFDDGLDYDDSVFFCGYQLTAGYTADEYPFAVNSGQVSSFPEILVGGDKYSHIQLNSINLGGNSGAPLFRKASNKVIGIINGNMNLGSDNFAFINDSGGKINFTKGSFRPPLSIAFATYLKTIREGTNLLNRLLEVRRSGIKEWVKKALLGLKPKRFQRRPM